MLPFLDHQDAVGALDRREPVGDDEARAALHQRLHALLDQRLGERVHRAGRLVHDEDLRLGQHRARQADELLLPDGEQVAALAHLGRRSPSPSVTMKSCAPASLAASSTSASVASSRP